MSRRTTARRVVVYEAVVERLIADSEPVVNKLHDRGRIPLGAQVRPLTDDLVVGVTRLHQFFPCPQALASLRLLGCAPEANYCRGRSRVLTLEHHVVGCALILDDVPGPTAFVYGVAVAPAWRRRWATPLLKYRTALDLRQMGITAVRFEAAVRDTHRQAARVHALTAMNPDLTFS